MWHRDQKSVWAMTLATVEEAPHASSEHVEIEECENENNQIGSAAYPGRHGWCRKREYLNGCTRLGKPNPLSGESM